MKKNVIFGIIARIVAKNYFFELKIKPKLYKQKELGMVHSSFIGETSSQKINLKDW